MVNTRARYLVPAFLCAVLALFLFEIRIGRGMRDFAVYRQAATRALYAEPLYRPEDGHYQFKYLPVFAYAMAPFAWFSEDGAKTIWYALSCMAGLMGPAKAGVKLTESEQSGHLPHCCSPAVVRRRCRGVCR